LASALSTERTLLHRIRGIGRGVLDLLLPLQCALCETSVEQIGQLCPACFARIGLIGEPCCVRCGVPFPAAAFGGPTKLCPSCAESPPIFRSARAAFRYDGASRRLILPFKHADRIELQRVLVPQMARAGGALLRQADVLVPVPLHRRRLFQRRYNQAALLARGLGRTSGRPVAVDALVRLQPTVPLGHMTAAERAAAVAGAFGVRPGRKPVLAGRQVLLIDDVMTSGATCNACAAVLLDAGAAAVDVLVAARVPDPQLR
jgi:ComF family protein